MTNLRQMPRKPAKENFVQEQLYIEDQEPRVNIPQKNENKEEFERGVLIIDLF